MICVWPGMNGRTIRCMDVCVIEKLRSIRYFDRFLVQYTALFDSRAMRISELVVHWVTMQHNCRNEACIRYTCLELITYWCVTAIMTHHCYASLTFSIKSQQRYIFYFYHDKQDCVDQELNTHHCQMRKQHRKPALICRPNASVGVLGRRKSKMVRSLKFPTQEHTSSGDRV